MPESIFARSRGFLRETMKLAIAIAGALIITVAVVGGAYEAYQAYKRWNREAYLDTLRSAKGWPPDKVLEGAEAKISTKWGDGALLVQFDIAQLPPSGFDFNLGARFVLDFLDEDGFLLFRHSVPSTEMTRLHAGGEVKSLEWEGEILASPELYSKAASVDVSWVGVTAKTAPESSKAPSMIRENWRRLVIGMSPISVRDILGEPTYIEGGYFTYWVYGGKNRSHFPHVGFTDGRVSGWEEP